MKQKYLTPQERETKFQAGNDLISSNNSPFNAVNIPVDQALLVSRHWDRPQSNETTGTAYIFRIGSHNAPLKCDTLSFQPSENGGAAILHVEKSDQRYPHWIHLYEEIPSFIREQISENFKEKIKVTLNPIN